MNIEIIGNGVFGTFLFQLFSKESPKDSFRLVDILKEDASCEADVSILAVPAHAYREVLDKCDWRHVVNICSVQKDTTEWCRAVTENLTSLHPLFGPRTPADKRYSIQTFGCDSETEAKFLRMWSKISTIKTHLSDGEAIYPDLHDRMMARTHVAAVLAAKQLKVFVDRASDIPDELVPNSFRLMRDFVKTMEDMPVGTTSSILSNPYA